MVNESPVRGEWISVHAPDPRAIVLYIHGGGYVACSPQTHRPIAAGLARLTGLRVLSLDYRLAPEHKFPAASEDALAAYRHLRKQYPDTPIAVAGDSAGGGLAISLMLRLKNEGETLPACAVCFSAWTDLTASGESVRLNEMRDRMFYASTPPKFAAAYVDSDQLENIHASPVFGDFTGMPPILLQVGSTEILVDDSRRIHQKIQAAGGISEMQIYDDVFHSWQMGIGLLPEADAAMKSAAEFIRRHTSRSTIDK
jgi:acetyl esterase/lipase